MLKKPRKETIPERLDPGAYEPAPCSPGSIEQQLDMCETGDLHGDEVERHVEHDLVPEDRENADPVPLDVGINKFSMTMSEGDREGDEMSGDDHSSGLQGGEADLQTQPHVDSGIPGHRPEFTGGEDQIEARNAEAIREIRKAPKKGPGQRKAG